MVTLFSEHPYDFWQREFLKDHVNREIIQTVSEFKERITRHVSSTDRESLRATVEHAITRFEHVIDVNEMNIE